MKIGGPLLGPRKAKADRATLHLPPKPELDFERRQEVEDPKSVGFVQVHDGLLHGFIEMPKDALPALLKGLAADRMRYVILQGAPLRYRKANIRHFSIEMEMDEDDLPIS